VEVLAPEGNIVRKETTQLGEYKGNSCSCLTPQSSGIQTAVEQSLRET